MYDVYVQVGRTLSNWEAVEFRLALLHASFLGTPNHLTALQSYGSGRIFRDRLETLRRAADSYFVSTPDQPLEGAFDLLAQEASELADHRNDIAHGIVFLVSAMGPFLKHLEDPDDPLQYALVPPLYALRKHDHRGAPRYAYSSMDLNAMANRFMAFSDTVKVFAEGLTASQRSEQP